MSRQLGQKASVHEVNRGQSERKRDVGSINPDKEAVNGAPPRPFRRPPTTPTTSGRLRFVD